MAAAPDYTVLGATGFIGNHLAAALRRTGATCFTPARGDDAVFKKPLGRVFYCIGYTADFAKDPSATVEAHAALLGRILSEAQFDKLIYMSSVRLYDGLGGPVKTEGRGAPLGALDPWVQEWTVRADPAEVSRDAVLAVWADALAAPAYDGEPCWFHGDLHEGNLLVADGRLAAVIDWGAAGRGDPAIELNAMWGYLPESAADLYRATVGLDEAAYRRARGFALAPSISASTYYRETAPEIARGALETVRRLIASLG